MLTKILKGKIHRATVTQADLDYIGSIAIDRALCEQVGMVEHEAVLVADLNNGSRHETYVIFAEPGSGTVCVNGAAARLVNVGDHVIVFAFGYLGPDELANHKPRVLLVDDKNRPARMLSD